MGRRETGAAADAVEPRVAANAEGALDGYHPLPSVRGDLLAKLGRWTEARAEFERAASMTQDSREQELLLARAAECAASA